MIGLSNVQVLVFAMNANLRPKAVQFATRLRQANSSEKGVSVDLVLDDRKAKWVFQRADRLGARMVVLMGEDEAAQGKLVLKDLRGGGQQTVDEQDALGLVLQRLQESPAPAADSS